MTPKNLRKPEPDALFENTLQQEKPNMYKSAHRLAKQFIELVSTWHGSPLKGASGQTSVCHYSRTTIQTLLLIWC